MPGQAAYRYWRRTQVSFQEGLWRLRGAHYARLKKQNRHVGGRAGAISTRSGQARGDEIGIRGQYLLAMGARTG
jgi:hypothetical protein